MEVAGHMGVRTTISQRPETKAYPISREAVTNGIKMTASQRFDIEIKRAVATNDLRWPTRDEAVTDSGLGCNRQYLDLRGSS